MDDALTPTPQFDAACATVGLELSADERHRLGRYLHLLLETNKSFNLTAISDPDQAWMRHILDSLSLLPHIGEAKRLIDIGTGAGLPGVPLAIAQPHLQVTLLEATGKKARFCEQAAALAGASNISIVNDRAETVGQNPQHRQRYDIAVARAVGPMRVMLELTLPFVAVGGRVLAMKGRRVEEELRDAGDALMELGAGEIELYESLPGLDDDAVIAEITKVSNTPRTYPRRPGEPKHNPL